jgi:hypothetical protein
LLAGPFLVILTGHGGGLAERIALYPLIIWLIVCGLAVLTKDLQAPAASESVQKPHAEMTSRANAAGM